MKPCPSTLKYQKTMDVESLRLPARFRGVRAFGLFYCSSLAYMVAVQYAYDILRIHWDSIPLLIVPLLVYIAYEALFCKAGM